MATSSRELYLQFILNKIKKYILLYRKLRKISKASAHFVSIVFNFVPFGRAVLTY